MLLTRTGLVLLALVVAAFLALFVGLRFAILFLVGVGFGLTLEGLRFGFAGPWKALVVRRDGRGVMAQLLAIGLTAAVALPLLAAAPGELMGAHAPVGAAMIAGAFVFGACMQIVMGCGSGTLVNAGSGNALGALALLFFIVGSFLGTLHLAWWTNLASLPVLTLSGLLGAEGALAATLAGLAAVAVVVGLRAEKGARLPQGRLFLAAALLAALAILNLVVAGQPWGIVYGLGLWGAKVATAAGADLSQTAFWAGPGNAERLASSILTDVTSLTNLGLVAGAFIAARWRRVMDPPPARPAARLVGGIVVAALLMGYASRLAFGCNVGAFFSGIATGSLHGWAWFAAAFAGSILGVRLLAWLQAAPRRAAGLEPAR
ncbi:YeeE/YedE thiosulfate transporter family protein [Salinarimonas rosea]|uniref:YeeE/YedE thiosulfate transporter family protein n=1 Tax=Salinarimonas rosea TaxID=552063 RepID=UPI0004159D6E|nr:YeeE/YedE thiosulfate transporter family protein [Salinarimonas rosea]